MAENGRDAGTVWDESGGGEFGVEENKNKRDDLYYMDLHRHALG